MYAEYKNYLSNAPDTPPSSSRMPGPPGFHSHRNQGSGTTPGEGTPHHHLGASRHCPNATPGQPAQHHTGSRSQGDATTAAWSATRRPGARRSRHQAARGLSKLPWPRRMRPPITRHSAKCTTQKRRTTPALSPSSSRQLEQATMPSRILQRPSQEPPDPSSPIRHCYQRYPSSPLPSSEAWPATWK